MTTQETTQHRGSPGRVVLIVLGAVLGLVAIGLLAGGGGLVWANSTQRDHAGYFTTSTHHYQTGTYALTSEDFDVTGTPSWIHTHKLATVRIRALDDQPLFVGIGRKAGVSMYLAGVAHTGVTDLTGDGPGYATIAGNRTPATPQSQDIWSAAKTGKGNVTVTWPLKQGHWSVVVMNANGSRGVTASIQAGAKVKYLGWVSVGLFIGGAIVAGLAALLFLLGIGRRGGGAPVPAVPGGPAPEPATREVAAEHASYPLQIEAKLDEPLSRWLWLVKWILAIPHVIVLAVLWIAYAVLTVVALFAILFTGRYPRSIFDFNVGVLRWTWRVSYYSTSAFGTDRYPPFTLADVPDYPARLDVVYPERLSRGLVLVKWWLLAIPHYLIVGVLVGGGWSLGWDDHLRYLGGGLIGLLAVIAGVVLLFKGRYPHGVYNLVLGFNRWVYRVIAYATLLTDEYPPFRLDEGGEEPPRPVVGVSVPI